jgi:hypothetical protein
VRVVRSAEIEKPIIEKTIKDLAEYYFTQITPHQVEMYIEDLMDLGSETVQAAAKEYRLHFDHDKFPLPGKLRKTALFLNDEIWSHKKQMPC